MTIYRTKDIDPVTGKPDIIARLYGSFGLSLPGGELAENILLDLSQVLDEWVEITEEEYIRLYSDTIGRTSKFLEFIQRQE